MIHLAARLHAFVYGLFQPNDAAVARELYREVQSLVTGKGVASEAGREEFAWSLARDAARECGAGPDDALPILAKALLDYERLFILPDVDWAQRRSVSDWWALRDSLLVQKAALIDFDHH